MWSTSHDLRLVLYTFKIRQLMSLDWVLLLKRLAICSMQYLQESIGSRRSGNERGLVINRRRMRKTMLYKRMTIKALWLATALLTIREPLMSHGWRSSKWGKNLRQSLKISEHWPIISTLMRLLHNSAWTISLATTPLPIWMISQSQLWHGHISNVCCQPSGPDGIMIPKIGTSRSLLLTILLWLSQLSFAFRSP